jgi:hypothetical protein
MKYHEVPKIYSYSLMYTIVKFQKFWHKFNFVQDRIELCVGSFECIFKGVQLKFTLEPARRMTALLPVLTPSSILPLPLSNWTFILQRKTWLLF